ncbi:MAG: HdeD family acid-resistance protein [Terracidiphilus sp.]
MSDSITSATFQMTREMVHQWGWFLAFGIVLAILGLAAMIRSFSSTVASMLFIGWLLIFGGAIEFIESFMVGHWAGFFLHLLAAVLLLFTGTLFISKPLISAEVATFVMSLFFVVGGVYEIIASLWFHLQGWSWHVLSGVLSMVLGCLLLAQWPLAGLWAIGFFVGIYLFASGIGWIGMAIGLRKM